MIKFDIRHYFCYICIGVFSTSVHLAVALLVFNQVDVWLEVYSYRYMLSNTIAFCCANLFAYILNTKLCFSAKFSVKNFWRYLTVSMFGLIVIVFLSYVATLLEFKPFLSVLFVAIVLPLLNYLLHLAWTYR